MGKATLAVPRCREAGGDQFLRAFAEVRPDLVRALARLLGNPQDAQDAAQEAFLKCWRARARLGAVRNLRAWIFRVGLNTARDLRRNVWRRRARPLVGEPASDPRPDASPGDQALRAEALERLHTALAGLPAEERAVFLLRQNSDLTYDEIAALRHAPVGTVKTRMRSALHRLRAALHEV